LVGIVCDILYRMASVGLEDGEWCRFQDLVGIVCGILHRMASVGFEEGEWCRFQVSHLGIRLLAQT
jgi:hypothetical protein